MTGQQPYIAMIVDDEPFVREDLKFHLSGYAGISVAWEAGSIGEARAILADNDLDLLFLDIRLRGGSGFDLIPWVDPGRTRIVFVTAHEDLLDPKGKWPGALVLLKPVSPSSLARVLAHVDRGP